MKIIDNKLIADFKIDLKSKKTIPIEEYRKLLKDKFPNRKGFYITEIADLYYKSVYNLNILEVFSEFIDIPKCPVTNKLVSYKLSGNVILGKYSPDAFLKGMSKHIANNNENYKNHIKNMKINRLGEKNPMYGITAWNKGLNKTNNEIMKQNSEKRKGIIFSDETLKKQSESAKKRLKHGHTGIKHSEESKQIMREKTIERLKSGKFPQTNTLPHRKFAEMLNEININNYEEEFKYGHFSFDFKVDNFLIEIHGDYWHANPNTRHSGATHSVQKINISRDKAKLNFVTKNEEYELIVFWENEIINQPEKIKSCLKELIK